MDKRIIGQGPNTEHHGANNGTGEAAFKTIKIQTPSDQMSMCIRMSNLC